MTDDLLARAEEKQERAPARWERLFSLPVLLLLGWLVFELTAQPALGIVVLCLKFGLRDVQVACWLRHTDPWRARGRATYQVYLASAGWKVIGGAFLLIFVLIILHVDAIRRKPQPPGPAPPIL